jgi:hypothetical protein
MWLSLAALMLFFNTAVPLYAGGGVSYLYEPLLSQIVELEQLDSGNRNYEMVPYNIMENPSLLQGEVLQASGSSPVTADCEGTTLTEGEFVCSEFRHTENVSESGSGDTFSKDCPVTVAFATYPAFFFGRDVDGDNRYIPFNPQDRRQKVEWSDFANVGMQRGANASAVEGENMYPASDIREGYRNVLPPNAGDDVLEGQDLKERTVTKAAFSTSGGDAEMTQGEPTRIGTDPCEEDPSEEGAEACPSGKLSFVTTEEATYGFMPPDPEKRAGRPQGAETVCYVVENVKYQIACINELDLLFGWVMRFQGILENIQCRIEGNCLENVRVVIDTDSLLGTNEGCEEPCMDFSHDLYISSMNPPNTGGSCSSYGEGMNSPCWEDSYIGTPGFCRVCGKLTPCTLLWKNWIKTDYEWMKAGIGPCDPEENPYCEWEGYWEEVKRGTRGISLGT